MTSIGDFRIVTDDKWFRIVDKKGNVIRKFSINKYEMDHIRAYREGYVTGLNQSVFH